MSAFFFIYIGNLLNYIDRGVVSTLLPTFETQFDLNKVEQGLIASSFMIGYSICSLLFTYLSNRYCSKKLLIFGNIVWCISALCMLTANDKNIIIIARSLSGVGEAAYQSLIPRMLNEHYGELNGSKKTSIFYTAITIGTAIGLLSGGFCSIHTWRYLYLFECLLGIVVTIGQYRTFNYTPIIQGDVSTGNFYSYNSRTVKHKKIEEIDRENIRENNNLSEIQKFCMVVSQPDWLFITTICACLTFANGTLLLWLPTLYKDLYVPRYSYSFVSGMMSISCLLFGIIGSLLGDRLPKRWYGNHFTKSENIFKIGFRVSLLLIPALVLTIMVKNNFWLSLLGISITFALFSFIMIPNSLVSVKCVPIQFQSYSVSFNILFVHLFGDMPSPLITSAIWNSNHNLQVSLFISMSSIIGAIILYKYAHNKHYKKTKEIENRERFRKSLGLLNKKLIPDEPNEYLDPTKNETAVL